MINVLEPKTLGCGSYGCVYHPPFPSIDPELTEKYKDHVMKVQDTSDDVEEYEQELINKLKLIDPEQKHFIYIVGKTKITSYTKCTSSDCFNNICNPIGYYMKHGGQTLEYIAKNNPKIFIKNLTKWLGDILEAIKILQANKIVHSDIKKENILINLEDNRARLIDFSLSYLYSDFSSQARTYTFYSVLPPFMNLLSNQLDRDGTAGFIKWANSKYNKLSNGYHLCKMIQQYELNTNKFWRYAREHWDLIDIFSTGTELLDILIKHKLTEHIHPMIKYLLYSMCDIHPLEQFNLSQAMNTLKIHMECIS